MINLQTEKEPKINFFDFGAFQEIMQNLQMLSHDKLIFGMVLGSFHDTSPPYSSSLSVASFLSFKRHKDVFRDFFTGSLTETELENHRYDQPAEVI